jgi:hypothetical protein
VLNSGWMALAKGHVCMVAWHVMWMPSVALGLCEPGGPCGDASERGLYIIERQKKVREYGGRGARLVVLRG